MAASVQWAERVNGTSLLTYAGLFVRGGPTTAKASPLVELGGRLNGKRCVPWFPMANDVFHNFQWQMMCSIISNGK